MNHNEIEARLTDIGNNWPVPSVADSVARTIESMPALQIARPRSRRLQWTLAGSILMLLVAVSVIWMTTLGAPKTLAAQVKDAIQKSSTVHVLISTIDAKQNRIDGEAWYSRAGGFRLESASENVVDDGKQQWTWNAGVNQDERTVYRRASHVDVGMIMNMTGLESMPADWRRSRSVDFDRDIHGKHCEAHLLEPSTSISSMAYGDSEPSPMRMIAWLDKGNRIVQIDTQHRTNDQWVNRREMSIDYDIEIAADKFAVTFPPTTKIVDADALWSTRFPLEKSLAKVESGGLLFAVHEAIRCEGDMFYIVSSVRGTSDHVKKYPPKRRQFNLQRSFLEVAEQRTAAGTSGGGYTAILTTAEFEGVNYVWWIAVPQKTYYMKDGVQMVLETPSKLEPEPGKVRIELAARYRDPRAGNDWVNTHVDLNLPKEVPPESLVAIAGRARRDALLDSDGLNLYGRMKEGSHQFVRPASVTDAEYAKEFQSQIDWLHSFDTVLDEAPIQSPIVNFPFRIPAKIEGRVVYFRGKPVANAKVTVRIQRWNPYVSPTDPAAPKPWVVTTDDQGHYEFSTDEPSMESGDQMTIMTQVEGCPTQRATDYFLQFLSGTFPAQRLFDGRTAKGRIVDPQGKPLTQAIVRLHSNSSPSTMSLMWDSGPFPVDDDGAFQLMIPAAEKAAIEIYPSGYAPQVVEIPVGDANLGTIKVQKGTSLTGRVVDKSGKGIAGTVVAIQSEKITQLFLLGVLNATAVKTDETGKFTLPPFRGKCVVSVTDGAPDFSKQWYVEGIKPPAIPPLKIELDGKEETKTILLRE